MTNKKENWEENVRNKAKVIVRSIDYGWEGFSEEDGDNVVNTIVDLVLQTEERMREEIVEKAAHCFHPYCRGEDKSCFEKLQEIIKSLINKEQ